MASYSIIEIGSDYVEITVTNAVIGNKYAVYIRKTDETASSPWSTHTARSTTFTMYLGGLDPETDYVINVDGNYQGGGAIWLGGQTFTTASEVQSDPPTFGIYSITATSVVVEIEHLEPYSSVRIIYHAEDGPDLYTGATANSVGIAATLIGGLAPNTTYTINVDINPDGGGVDDFIGAQTFTTLRGRPTDWWWRSDVESEAEINISASEWNDFCKRINEFREYVNVGTYDLEIVSSGDYITASIVNKARSAIDGATGHGTLPPRAYAEDYIYASFFNQLKDALNAIP